MVGHGGSPRGTVCRMESLITKTQPPWRRDSSDGLHAVYRRQIGLHLHDLRVEAGKLSGERHSDGVAPFDEHHRAIAKLIRTVVELADDLAVDRVDRAADLDERRQRSR